MQCCTRQSAGPAIGIGARSAVATVGTGLRLLAVVAALVLPGPLLAVETSAPLSIQGLRALAARPTPLNRVAEIDGGEGFSAYLMAYRNSGLLLHAMVAVPAVQVPMQGLPVLVVNHGFHPDPPRYGITPEGRDWRPGDYYRRVPAAYAAAGFLVVVPDYRGHNNSEGREFTQRALASFYYAQDVVALLSGLGSIQHADLDNVFMWGHSMGGEVTLLALLAGAKVRGASLWSTTGGGAWERAFRFARTNDPMAFDTNRTPKHPLDALELELASLGPGFDLASIDPLNNLYRLNTPLMLQHAVEDQSTDYRWSARLAAELYRLHKSYAFHSYPGSSHFFAGTEFDTAVARDVAFFRALMVPRATTSR